MWLSCRLQGSRSALENKTSLASCDSPLPSTAEKHTHSGTAFTPCLSITNNYILRSTDLHRIARLKETQNDSKYNLCLCLCGHMVSTSDHFCFSLFFFLVVFLPGCVHFISFVVILMHLALFSVYFWYFSCLWCHFVSIFGHSLCLWDDFVSIFDNLFRVF